MMELIFLHGPAASGKLTTALALERRLGYPVFHNHLAVDLLTTLFEFGSEPFVRLREQIWLDIIADAARIGRSTIFTFAPEATVSTGFPDRLRRTVDDHGGRLHSVALELSLEAQEARIGDPGRSAFGKLTDVDVLRSLRRDGRDVELPVADLVIDTERSDPETSAETMISTFGLQPQPPVERYPVGP